MKDNEWPVTIVFDTLEITLLRYEAKKAKLSVVDYIYRAAMREMIKGST